jgi:DNA-nicking Smr family endonuclease
MFIIKFGLGFQVQSANATFLSFLWVPTMPRKKKRKVHQPRPKEPKKEAQIFNPAFGSLASLKEEKGEVPGTQEMVERPEPEKVPKETQYFLEAMRDVEPLKGPKKKIMPSPDINIWPSHPAPDDELEAMAHLSDLVSGAAELDITFSDEYIEGAVRGFDRRLMGRLKRGQFPVQDYIDLHGLTKQEAEARIHAFLRESYGLGLRCVLVVHGRGLNSEDNIPVLKERLPVWLSRGPIRKIVLAFSTAMPYDGGTGAIYILLKRGRGRV